MIYTLTFSPAIDYVIYMDGLNKGVTNRSRREECFPGGKGINVSIILTALGVENTALGFVAGFTGEALEKGLKERGVKTDFIHLEEGMTRINIKIKTDEETEINTQGAAIPEEKLRQMLKKLNQLKQGDVLILSGTVPSNLPDNIYEIILNNLEGRGVQYVVDAGGELLKKALKFRPLFVKPNKDELEVLNGSEIHTDADLKAAARQLTEMGAQNVLVSLGGEGAYLLCEDGQEYRRKAIVAQVKNTVGAGDSMVAGFLAGCLAHGDYEKALKLGVAAGSATACSEDLATADKIMEFYQKSL
ncbi:MAG: 1-phosphofructokinase [Firmicutes bacterium]|nr:1-phosphofructokinase [Bacillota bacterium]